MKFKNKIMRSTAILLLISMLLPALSACTGGDKPDPGEESENMENYYIKLEHLEAERDPIFDWSDGMLMSENAAFKDRVNRNYVFENDNYYDDASLHLTGTDSGLQIVSPLITDWSEYTAISFAIYSEKITNTTMQLRFNNPANGVTSMPPYYRIPFTVDWTGWKEFTVSIDNLSGNYNHVSSNIISMNLDTSGWGLTCSPENSIYLGAVYLVKDQYNIISEVPLDDPTIYNKVKDQWREYLVGSPEKSAERSEEYKAKVASISQSSANMWDQYIKAGDKKWGISITFGNAGDEAKISNLYDRIKNLALGYATVGTNLYHDKRLLSDIKEALDFAYDNYYGPTVSSMGTYGNWWYWDIGIPMTLVDILLILEDELGTETVKKYLEPFDYLNKYPSMTACNKIWITYSCLASAFLQNDAERILLSKMMMNDVFDYVTTGDGFYTDGSFIQHDKHPYTGGYGLSMLSSLSTIMLVMRGSRFDLIEENVKNQYRWVFENFRPVIYDGNFFASVRGREVSRNTSEAAALTTAVASMIKMTTYAPADIKPQLESLIRHYMLASQKNYASNVPLSLIDYSVALYSDSSVTPSDYQAVKVLGMMDRVVQHGEKYGVCVALNSTRIYKYEAINNENMEGWYHSDGMIYIYTDGYDYNYSFFNYVDPYKIPGTTINTRTRTVENVTPILGSSAFVGGVESGKYGLAVFDLGYGVNNYFSTDITAHKSYFLFDNEIVAVGSGISDSSGTDVQTIIENRIWRSDDVFSVNGTKTSLTNGNTESAAVKTMHFTNMGGYVFPNETNVSFRKVSNSTSFLEIWTSHGKNPKNGTYAYIYLPEATSAETEAYSASPDVEILTLAQDVHVVRENTLKTTGYAFYKPGEANGVKVSNQCAVMVRESDEEYIVTVSDPTHLLTKLTVTLELPVSSVVSSDSEADVSINSGKVTVELNIEGNVGQTYTVTLK